MDVQINLHKLLNTSEGTRFWDYCCRYLLIRGDTATLHTDLLFVFNAVQKALDENSFDSGINAIIDHVKSEYEWRKKEYPRRKMTKKLKEWLEANVK